MADPGLNFEGDKIQKVQILATKLAKYRVKQRKNTVMGGGKCPILLPPGSTIAHILLIQNSIFLLPRTPKNIRLWNNRN